MMPLKCSHSQTTFGLAECILNAQNMSYKVIMPVSLSKEYNDQKVNRMPESRIPLVIEASESHDH